MTKCRQIQIDMTKTERYILYLFKHALLLLEGGGVQLQECGRNAHRQVAGVHLVGVGALQDVMENAEQLL